MLKRDFIMVQIEELGKIVQQIITHRNNNDGARIPDLIETVYSSLKIDREDLMNKEPAELIALMDRDDNGGKLRLETAIKVLIEENYLYPEQKSNLLKRAKMLIEYLQTHDNTFSLERVAQLNDIDALLRNTLQ